MKSQLALIVGNRENVFQELRNTLEQQGIETLWVETCGYAQAALAAGMVPRLVFTETVLPDGTWHEVVRLAENAPKPVEVVLVSPHIDVDLHLTALKCGASEFTVPPLLPADVAHVVHNAEVFFRRCSNPHSERETAA
jgi:DNA-binding NtrC family response regulator